MPNSKKVNKMKKLFFISIAALLLFFSAGCISPEQEQGKMKVAATILPQAQFVEAVGGERVQTIVMVPPGASPHTHEPTPSQLMELEHSSLYFMVGSGVEFELAWMDGIKGVNSRMKVVDCSKGIALMEMDAHTHEEHSHEEHTHGHEEHENGHQETENGSHTHSGTDPHIWTSPRNVKIMVENIYSALAEEDPENAAYYRANADEYLAKLDALDSSISSSLEGKQNRKFIVFHPAWGYFARDYGLEQVAIEEAGKEPTALTLQRVIDGANEHGIKVVFASPQFSTSSAGTVASEIGGTVVLINPLSEDYLANMEVVAAAFAKN